MSTLKRPSSIVFLSIVSFPNSFGKTLNLSHPLRHPTLFEQMCYLVLMKLSILTGSDKNLAKKGQKLFHLYSFYDKVFTLASYLI